MVNKIITCWLLLGSIAAMAEVPDPRKWFNESRSNFVENDIFRRYLFLEKKGEEWTPLATKDSGLLYNVPSVYMEFQKNQGDESKIEKSRVSD